MKSKREGVEKNQEEKEKMKEMKEMKRTSETRDRGFTLVEVMAVMIIVAVLAAIAIPKLTSSSDTARKNADIATGHEVKSALDRYQVENGLYPKFSDIVASEGALANADFIPKYVSKLDKSTTQQKAGDTVKGFAKEHLPTTGSTYPAATRLIMLFLTDDGSAAEVRVYRENLTDVLWTSAL